MKKEALQYLIQFAPLLYQNRLHEIILYGSVAREEDGDDSDIDVLFVFDNEGFRGFSELRNIQPINVEILLHYGEIISALPTTTYLYSTKKTPLYLNIKKEGKTLWKKSNY